MSEYSDLQSAKEAAKGLHGNARTLLGIAYNKAKNVVVDIHSQVTTPLSMGEQALRTVNAIEKRTVRNAKIRQVSNRVGGFMVADLLGGIKNATQGAVEGIVGYTSKATKLMAENESNPPRSGEVKDINNEVEEQAEGPKANGNPDEVQKTKGPQTTE